MVAPKLRFKEFDGDWVKKTLGEVVKFSNGKRSPLSESERQKRQGDYRYYGASSVIDYIDDYLFNGEYILIGEDGANIIARSSTLAFVVTGKFWVNNHAHIFQSKDGNNIFLATYLESLNFEKFNSGTAQPKLNLENFSVRRPRLHLFQATGSANVLCCQQHVLKMRLHPHNASEPLQLVARSKDDNVQYHTPYALSC